MNMNNIHTTRHRHIVADRRSQLNLLIRITRRHPRVGVWSQGSCERLQLPFDLEGLPQRRPLPPQAEPQEIQEIRLQRQKEIVSRMIFKRGGREWVGNVGIMRDEVD